jgi:G:T-mismatch repair DNA endonuclease (very short patch repair protein)
MKTYKDFDKDKIINTYLKCGSSNKVAQQTSCSQFMVLRILKENNIKIIPYKLTQEEKQNASRIRLELWKEPSYRKIQSESHKGIIPSKESLIKRSNSIKKNLPSTIFKKGIIPWNKDKKDIFSKEILDKIKESRNKKAYIIYSKEANLKRSLSLKGKQKSPEHIKKVADFHRGRKRSKETCERKRQDRAKQIIPTQDTSIEIKIQNLLSLLHIEYIAHKYISEIEHNYRCDIFIPEQEGITQKTIIECDGDYWHGNPYFYPEEKLNHKQIGQRERDEFRTKELIEKGFRVIRIWEHEIKKMKVNELKEKLK